MVKNTTGGSGHKSLARKLTSHVGDRSEPMPSDPLEHIAVVSKIHGAHCDVTFDGQTIICHIRNKFRGRNKRQNTIRVGSFVLIGIRDFQPTHSDLIFVYNDDTFNLHEQQQHSSLEHEHEHQPLLHDHSLPDLELI
jgi:translation initiation factor IF-1